MQIDYFDRNQYNIDGLVVKEAADVVDHLLTKESYAAIISPANSFGFMDGGIEKVYMDTIPFVQDRVYNGIRAMGRRTSLGRMHLPVGCCLGFQIGEPEWSNYFISAPTMFLPGDVSQTQNAYWAMSAARYLAGAMLACRQVHCSLMCTGYGKMSPAISIAQMQASANNPSQFTAEFAMVKGLGYYFCHPKQNELNNIKKNQPHDYMLQEFVEIE